MVAMILGEPLTVLALRSIGDGDGASEVRHKAVRSGVPAEASMTG